MYLIKWPLIFEWEEQTWNSKSIGALRLCCYHSCKQHYNIMNIWQTHSNPKYFTSACWEDLTAVLGQKINTIYRSDDCMHLRLNMIYHFNFVQAKVKQHVSPLIDWVLECTLPLGLDETPLWTWIYVYANGVLWMDLTSDGPLLALTSLLLLATTVVVDHFRYF